MAILQLEEANWNLTVFFFEYFNCLINVLFSFTLQDAVNKAIPTEPTPPPIPQIGPQLSASTSTSSNIATETPEVFNPFRATATSSVENSRTSSPPIMVDDSPTPPVRMGKVF